MRRRSQAGARTTTCETSPDGNLVATSRGYRRGVMIGRFVLLDALGSGGAATVWRARDPLTGQPAAVKLLREGLTELPAQRRAFLAEARLAGRVTHPGAVRIIDCGEQERPGLPPQAWLAMELLDGRSLSEQVRAHGPLPVLDALLLGEALLLALDAVHRAGLVHRDVTPANIMLRITPGQPLDPATVRLCDFGLAGTPGGTPAAATPPPAAPAPPAPPVSRARGRKSLGIASETANRVPLRERGEGEPVVPTHVWGSAPYLAPEHAAGQPVFAAADLYQAGGVLYFALTGRAPFTRDSTEALLQAHLAEPAVPPSSRRPEVPAAVDRLLLRALRKAPLERFDSALDMHRELRATRLALAENAVVTAQLPVLAAGAAPGLRDEHVDLAAALAQAAGSGSAQFAQTSPAQTGTAEPGVSALKIGRAGLPRSRRLSGRGVLVAGAAVVAAMLAAGGVLGVLGDRATPRVDAVTAAVAQPTAEAPGVAPAPAAQRLTQVPALVGRTLAEARALLAAAGLTLGRIDTSHSASPADTVLAMAQTAGVRVAPGTTIALTIASGWNIVPDVTGLSESQASAALAAAGFTATAYIVGEGAAAPAPGAGAEPGTQTGSGPGAGPGSEPGSETPPGASTAQVRVVRSALPVAGTVLRLGASVSLALAVPAPAPTQEPQPQPQPTAPSTPSGPADPPRPNGPDCSPAVSECLP